MKTIRKASYDEYIEWYLSREKRKHPDFEVPSSSQARRKLMEHKHAGKLQQWFPSASWTIVSLDLPECEHLVYLDSDWTKANKLTNQSDGQNYRLLRRVSENAIRLNYFESDDPKCKSHRDYYKLFREGKLNLKDDPVAVCTLNANERSSNPQGTFYIQDGNGRALPYLVLVMEQKIVFEPVHAFLAEQP